MNGRSNDSQRTDDLVSGSRKQTSALAAFFAVFASAPVTVRPTMNTAAAKTSTSFFTFFPPGLLLSFLVRRNATAPPLKLQTGDSVPHSLGRYQPPRASWASVADGRDLGSGDKSSEGRRLHGDAHVGHGPGGCEQAAQHQRRRPAHSSRLAGRRRTQLAGRPLCGQHA